MSRTPLIVSPVLTSEPNSTSAFGSDPISGISCGWKSLIGPFVSCQMKLNPPDPSADA